VGDGHTLYYKGLWIKVVCKLRWHVLVRSAMQLWVIEVKWQIMRVWV